jgi:hypothetical protein
LNDQQLTQVPHSHHHPLDVNRGNYTLLMTNITTAKGWVQKSNLNKVGKEPLQTTVRTDTAHHHTHLFMDAKIKGYSQWFTRKLNNVTDALYWDWHPDGKELTSTLCLNFPQQMLAQFKISLLPSKINSWLISLLCLGQMGVLLPLSWMSKHLHGQPQQARENPLSWSICRGCQEWEILRFAIQHTG